MYRSRVRGVRWTLSCFVSLLFLSCFSATTAWAGAGIGDFVWSDLDADGVQDPNEPGVPGVMVNLLDCSGGFVASTATALNGEYHFETTAGCYMLQFFPPGGLAFSPRDQTGDAADSDPDPTTGITIQTQLEPNEQDLTWDAGLITPVPGSDLGDRFWRDLNANGRQDPGEPGIPGATVQLLDCQNQVLATDVTDATGLYLFEDLATGCYRIKFVKPAGCFFSPANVGPGDQLDSDANPTNGRTGNINLGANVSDLSWDAGCYVKAKLGDFVWHDLDQDGRQDAGEPGIPGLTVILLDENMVPTGLTDVTDASGKYLFTNLVPGGYFVQFTAPPGFVYSPQDVGNDTRDSDANATGKTGLIVLDSGEIDKTNDAGVYQPANPAISIVKSTNGFDANDPTGPFIPVGGAVLWEYVVTNIGNVPLTNVTVLDDHGVAVSCPKTTLAVGEQMICTAHGIAEIGQYANLGSTCGTPPVGALVCDNDPSHYFGARPDIDIEKFTNGDDADTPPGPTVPVGGAVTWTYVVTNTGNVTLENVSVTDDQGVAVSCPISTLTPGQSMTCVASGIAAPGQYANVGTTCGDSADGQEVCDDDPSHYFGAEPDIDIEKFTNGADADTPTGPVIPVGGAVQWTYIVTNTGDVTLTNVFVNDDQGVAVSCPLTTLAPGQSMTCTAAGIAAPGQYANVGRTCGNPPAGAPVCDEDPSHYFGALPDIDIRKNAEGPDSQTIIAGGSVTFQIVVTNTGNIPLTNVVVTDVQAPGCAANIGNLAVGASATYSCTLPVVNAGFTNEACASGMGGGVPVDDCDPSTVEVIDIDIRKNAEGPDSQSVPFGSTVTFTIVVTNTGTSALTNVVVTDVLAPNCGRVIGNLAVGASVSYDCTVPNVTASFTNEACVTGSRNGVSVGDCDPSTVVVVQACALTVDKTCAIAIPPDLEYVCNTDMLTLSFIWNGAQNVRIKAYKGAVGSQLLADIDNIVPGEEITVTGYAGSPNDVVFEVFNAGTSTLIGLSTFHVSCSDDDMDGPEDCGKLEGNGKNTGGSWINQWLLEGIVDEGGELDCTGDPSPPAQSCSFQAQEVSCDTLSETPNELTFRYTGGGCGASDNPQDGKHTCSGTINPALPVTVTLEGGATLVVNPGATFTIPRAGSDTDISLTNTGGTEAQRIHTSCSQALAVGDVFGSLTLVALDGQTGAADVTYGYLVTNSGPVTATGISVVDDPLGTVPGSPIASLAPGASASLSAMALISETTTNTVTVTGNSGGQQCTAMDMTTVTAIPPPPDITCSTPIDALSMIWDGTEPIRVRAHKGNTSAPVLADIDNVQIGQEIMVSGMGGSPNDQFWEVFHAGTSTLIGLSKFHISCSDDDMDDEDDCGKRQGNAKSNTDPTLINDWLFEGMVDSNETLDCHP